MAYSSRGPSRSYRDVRDYDELQDRLHPAGFYDYVHGSSRHRSPPRSPYDSGYGPSPLAHPDSRYQPGYTETVHTHTVRTERVVRDGSDQSYGARIASSVRDGYEGFSSRARPGAASAVDPSRYFEVKWADDEPRLYASNSYSSRSGPSYAEPSRESSSCYHTSSRTGGSYRSSDIPHSSRSRPDQYSSSSRMNDGDLRGESNPSPPSRTEYYSSSPWAQTSPRVEPESRYHGDTDERYSERSHREEPSRRSRREEPARKSYREEPSHKSRTEKSYGKEHSRLKAERRSEHHSLRHSKPSCARSPSTRRSERPKPSRARSPLPIGRLPPTELPDYYAVLHISPNATADQINRASKKKRIEVHPDKMKKRGMTKDQLAQIDETAKKVGMAAEVLGNATTRREYDLERSMRGLRVESDDEGYECRSDDWDEAECRSDGWDEGHYPQSDD